MGKKQERKSGGPVSIPHMPQKELYQRVNFAVQASTYLQSLGLDPHASSSDRKGKRKAFEHGLGQEEDESTLHESGKASRQRRQGDRLDYTTLAKGGMKATKRMVAHTQLKLDPSLKRNMCRGCGTYLIPGITSRVRNRPNGRTINVINTTCLECSDTLTIPAPPTSLGDPALDGPMRRRRREKVVARSKVAFHEREKAGEEERGHVLWSNDQRVDGWGQAAPTVEATYTGSVSVSTPAEGDPDEDEEAQFSMA